MTIACQLVNISAAGNLTINSTPIGARIWLAQHLGTFADQLVNTNTTLSLAVGSYDVKLVLAGYQDWVDTTGTITVTDGGTYTVNATLTPSTGSVTITSTPTGAEIWLGPHLGVLTDRGVTTAPGGTTISGQAPGSYDYKLTLTGYADATGTFSITANTNTPLSVTFAGSANITSTPTGAEIYIAAQPGTPVDQLVTTSHIITGLTTASPGETTTYNYRLTLAGYADVVGTFTATAGTTVSVSPTFTGDLNIVSTPSGAEIYIDGTDQLVITTSPTGTTITGVTVGSHDIRLTLAGYTDWTTTGVAISAGTTTAITATFAGSAYITSSPAVAEIYIAAQPGSPVDQGITTPHIITGLTAASSGATTTYNYKLTLTGYADATGTFAATAGSTVNVPVTMLTPPNITATNITVTTSQTPCMVGTCTVTVVVRWSNSGQTDGTVIPNIKIDNVSQIPHASRTVPAGSYIDETFIVSGLSAAAHTICPYPN